MFRISIFLVASKLTSYISALAMSNNHLFSDLNFVNAFQSPSPTSPVLPDPQTVAVPSSLSYRSLSPQTSPKHPSSQPGSSSSSLAAPNTSRKPYAKQFTLADVPQRFRPETSVGRLFFRLVDQHCQGIITDEICVLVLNKLGVTLVTSEHLRFIRNRICRRLKLLRRRARQPNP